MSHTPTPWLYEVTQDHAPAFVYVEDSENAFAGIAIADCKAVDLTDAQCDANAAFIVTACNAHDELVRDQLAKAAAIVRLHKQRDELVAALEAVCDASADSSQAKFAQAVIKARAALAKVKEA